MPQPQPTQKIRIFISYARVDAEIADRIVADLERAGLETRIDRRDLPYGEEWQAELAEFIRLSDTVVWLVSPSSLRSRWCNWELGEVQRTNKRLLPVRIRDLGDEPLPEVLGRVHVLPATDVYDSAQHAPLLAEALSQDRDWIRFHTRIADRAAEWSARGRRPDRLLRGRALAEAQRWRDERPDSAPRISSDALDLILQSRRAASRGLGFFAVVATAIVLATSALAIVAWDQRQAAQTTAMISDLQRQLAVAQVTVANDPVAALRAVSAATHASIDGGLPLAREMRTALMSILGTARELPSLGGLRGGLYTNLTGLVAAGRDKGVLVAGNQDGQLLDLEGRPIGEPLVGPERQAVFANSAIWFNQSQTTGVAYAIATGGEGPDGLINPGISLHAPDGSVLARVLTDNPAPILALAELPFRDQLLASDGNGAVFRISLGNGGVEKLAEGIGRPIFGIGTSGGNDQLLLAFGAPAGAPSEGIELPVPGRVWLDALAVKAGLGVGNVQAYLGDGDLTPACLANAPLAAPTSGVFVCNDYGGITHLNVSFQPLWPPFTSRTRLGQVGRTTAVAYSPELDAVAMGDATGNIEIWSLNGQALVQPMLHVDGGPVRALTFISGSTMLLSAGSDSHIHRWELSDVAPVPKRADVNADLLFVGASGETQMAIVDTYDQGSWLEIRRFGSGVAVEPFRAKLGVADADLARAGIDPGETVAGWSEPGHLTVQDLAAGTTRSVAFDAREQEPAFLAIAAGGRSALAISYPAGTSARYFAATLPAPPLVRFFSVPEGEAPLNLTAEAEGSVVNGITSLVALGGVAEDDGPAFVTGDRGGVLTFWSAAGLAVHTSQPLQSATGRPLFIRSIASSPDGTRLLVTGYPVEPGATGEAPNDILVLWDVTEQKLLSGPLAINRRTGPVAFDAAGELVAVATIIEAGDDDRRGLQFFEADDLNPLASKAIADMTDPDAVYFDHAGRVHVQSRFMKEYSWPARVDDLLAEADARLALHDTRQRFRGLMTAIELAGGKEATGLLRQAIALRDDVSLPHVLLGNSLYSSKWRTGDADASLAAYTAALAIEPHNVITLLHRGRVRYAIHDFAGAAEDFAAAERYPTELVWPTQGSRHTDISASLYGMTASIERSIRYEPTAYRGYALVEDQKWTEAIDVITAMLNDYEGQTRDFEYRARAYAELGRVPEALADLETALSGVQTGYSKLNDFMAYGETETKRHAIACRLAEQGADLVKATDGKATDGKAEVKWLQRAFDSCAAAWQADGNLGENLRLKMLDLARRLAVAGFYAPLPVGAEFSVRERLSVLVEKRDVAAITALRDALPSDPVAALASRALAMLDADPEQYPPETILGDWVYADDEEMSVRIEATADGGEVWKVVDKDPRFRPGEVIAESRGAPGPEWTHIGRHMWGASDSAPAYWGKDNMMLVALLDANTLFFAYLDNRYMNGWVMRRRNQ